MFRALRKLFGGSGASHLPPRPMLPPDPEPAAIVVPEVTVEELRVELAQDNPPCLLDVREPYEWRQVRIAASDKLRVVHIPMSVLPERVGELAARAPLVVLCAHGSRSYSVAAWLMEQGLAARSLAGGITAWSRSGGEVEQG